MRLLRPFLVAAIALLLVPISASPAQAANGTISGTALDASGKPLRNVNWEIYEFAGGEWRTFPFGPKLTDSKGRFSMQVPVGRPYRVCFHDRYYDEAETASGYWQPEVRHRDTCWPNATTVQGAQSWTPTTAAPSKSFSVALPKQGLGMAPVEPFIIGTYQVGQPLTIVGQEGWRPTNAAFSYQWMSQSNGTAPAPIAGATKATFVPTSAQSGKWVWATVTASRAGYKPASHTTPVTQVGTNHVQPTSPLRISGSARPGATLTASFGKPANTYNEIMWFVDGVPQARYKTYNAATSRFPVTAAHSGTRIDARLKLYKNDAQGNYLDGSDSYQRVQVQVSGSRPAQALPTAAKPKGTATVGRILKAPTGITADPKATVRYQWMRGATAVKGATGVRYKVRAADVNKKVRVRVTVARPGWWNRYVTTSTATVAKRALKSGSVKAVGTPKVGRKLTARTAKWGPKPVKVRFQWLRNGKVIRKATRSTYKLRASDRGKVIKVRVKVSKPKYLTVVKTSKGRKIRR